MTQYIPGALLGGYTGYQMYRKARANKDAKLTAKKLALRNSQKIRNIQRGSLHELKTHDVSMAGTISTSGAITLLSGIGQGDTSLSRDGLQVQPRNLQFKIRLVMSATATATQVRFLIFKDTENLGTLPLIGDLLEADTTMDFTEHDTRPRFKIMRDINFNLSINGDRITFLKGFIKLKGKCWFEGTDATQASVGKNSLYVYLVSNEATNTPTHTCRFRMRFNDP